jgi:hypothetical protein
MENRLSLSLARELGCGQDGRVFLLHGPNLLVISPISDLDSNALTNCLTQILALNTPKDKGSEGQRTSLIHESTILSELAHPTIIDYRGFIARPFGMLLEACPRGNLRTLMRWVRIQR